MAFRGHGVKLDAALAVAVREEFRKALQSGLAPTAAATVAGVSGATGRRWAKAAVIAGVSENAAVCWVEQAGFVPRTPFPAGFELAVRSGGALSFLERCRLEQLLEAGHSLAGAAGLLGRDRSTISREARRGATGSGYRARVGQEAFDANA